MPFSGEFAHAALLNWLGSAAPDVVAWLHEGNKRRLFTCSSLQFPWLVVRMREAEGKNIHLPLEPEKTYLVRITLLLGELFPLVYDALMRFNATRPTSRSIPGNTSPPFSALNDFLPTHCILPERSVCRQRTGDAAGTSGGKLAVRRMTAQDCARQWMLQYDQRAWGYERTRFWVLRKEELMQHASKEWVKVWHDPVLQGLELHHVIYITHMFSRHMHDYYVLGVIEAGIQAFSYREARQITPAGGIFVINPGEVHTGEALMASGYTYQAAAWSHAGPVCLTGTRDQKTTEKFLTAPCSRRRANARSKRALHLLEGYYGSGIAQTIYVSR